MKKALLFLLTLAVGILIGYVGHLRYQTHQVEEVNRSKVLIPQDSLKREVWHGDTNAYEKLHGIYRDYSPGQFLFWAMYMANNYHYANAYEDVYYSIVDEYPSDSAIFKMDNETREFALGYLKMAAQKGDTSAADLLNEMRQKHVPDEWLK